MSEPKKTRGPVSLSRSVRLRYGAVSTLLLIAVLAVLAGVNILAQHLEKRNAWKADLSFNEAVSYGEITAEVLRGLDRDVHAYMFIQDEVLCELLDRYAAATDHFTWERANLSLSPGLAARFRSELAEESASSNSIVFVCEETGRWRTVTGDQLITVTYDENGEAQLSGLRYEGAITSAIRYVSADTAPRILILQGHGEKTQSETVYLTELWNRSAYDVYGYSLNARQTTLEPSDLLVILSPASDLTEAEYATVHDFVQHGGCLLMSVDPETPIGAMPRFAELMRVYGMIPLDGAVYAARQDRDSYYQELRGWLFPRMEYTAATIPMILNGDTDVLLVNGRAFAEPSETGTTEVMLRSAPDARLIPLSRAASGDPEDDPEDETGAFPLALVCTRITEAGYASRAFVIGSTDTLLNAPDSDTDIWAGIDTEELILRVTDALFGGASLDAGIVARSAVRPALSVRSHAAGTLAVFMLPALVLAAAIVILGIRRRK